MCGIVGYTGNREAAPIVLEGLSKLEYRGYDSAGLAVRDGIRPAQVVKTTGRLKALEEKTEYGNAVKGTCGIGHTRWATHGNPDIVNAHPHVSGNCLHSGSGEVESDVAGVHNGIIENYAELKEKLSAHGYLFYSETDTEVLIKLVDYYYRKYRIGPIDAINRTMVRAHGSYALALMFKDYPGEIFAARKDSPLVIGTAGEESFLASDVPAILKYTRSVYYMNNLQAARILPGRAIFYNLNGDEVSLPVTRIDWDASAAEKDGYEHFMLKEIHEQPDAVRKTLSCRPPEEILKSISALDIVACGSAWHVGVAAQYIIEDLAEVPVRVETASEFRYRKLLQNSSSLVVVISQSGETADTLAALRKAKEAGIPVLAVVNVVGSSIAREADYVLYTMAGPEISVATTKAYNAQLTAMYILAVKLALLKKKIDDRQYEYYTEELKKLPEKIAEVLKDKQKIQRFASEITNKNDVFFIGRSLDYAICLEGSLKMKEISYIHSEAYPAGELKHGTISLIEENTPVIGVLTQSSICSKTVSNLIECKSRGAKILCLASEGCSLPAGLADTLVTIPETDAHFTASPAVVPLQLLGYYTSVNRGLDVDKPRNLAKSVTVE